MERYLFFLQPLGPSRIPSYKTNICARATPPSPGHSPSRRNGATPTCAQELTDQRTKLKLRIGPEDRAVRRVDPHPCMGYDAVDSADSFAWTSLPRELGSSHPCLHRSHRHATHSSVRVAQHETRPTDQSTADDEHCASLAHTHKSLYGVSNARERAGAQLHQSLQQLDFQAVRAVCHID